MSPVTTNDTTRVIDNGWGGNQPLPVSDIVVGDKRGTQLLLKLTREEWRELGKPNRVISLLIVENNGISAIVREVGTLATEH